jgi:hypothetical protein
MRSGFEGFRSIGRKGKAEFISPAVRRLEVRDGSMLSKKSFASLNTNSPSCRRGDLINVWGEASQSDELAGDFGN